MGRHLVCSAKMSGISTTIKVYEPMDTISKNKKKPAIGRMFQGGQEALKPFKVFLVARLYKISSECMNRNSTYRLNHHPSTSCVPSFVSRVPVALKS